MKKTLIALAVAAGTIAAAQADTTTLYGSLGFSSVISQTDLNVDKNGNVIKRAGDAAENVFKNVKNNHWGIVTSSASFGVKGAEDLSNGLQAIYKFEFGANEISGLDDTKYAYVGLKGDFGTVTIGKQKSLLKVVTGTGLFQEVGIEYVGKPKVSRAVSYVSPASAGLQLGAAVVADTDNYASLGADAWEVAAMYKLNGFDAGVVYHYAEDAQKNPKVNNKGEIVANHTGSTEIIGLNLGYNNDVYGVVGRAVHVSSHGTEFGLEGEYKAGPNTFRAGFGVGDSSLDGVKSQYKAALGYQYDFSERTYTWVEAEYEDFNDDNKDNGFKALVGIRHDF